MRTAYHYFVWQERQMALPLFGSSAHLTTVSPPHVAGITLALVRPESPSALGSLKNNGLGACGLWQEAHSTQSALVPAPALAPFAP